MPRPCSTNRYAVPRPQPETGAGPGTHQRFIACIPVPARRKTFRPSCPGPAHDPGALRKRHGSRIRFTPACRHYAAATRKCQAQAFDFKRLIEFISTLKQVYIRFIPAGDGLKIALPVHTTTPTRNGRRRGPRGPRRENKTAFFSKLNERSFIITPEKPPPGTAVRVNQNKNDVPTGLIIEISDD